ncbi:hypothetical protein JXA32_12030 [Candidatus Sumerlaeota bacterium]|nr:hypothetical protein [Candidatus Sumerlaeota bacterium]
MAKTDDPQRDFPGDNPAACCGQHCNAVLCQPITTSSPKQLKQRDLSNKILPPFHFKPDGEDAEIRSAAEEIYQELKKKT